MSFTMSDYVVHSQEEDTVMRNNLRKQLAAVVTRIGWSYAIFWSLSKSTNPRVLEWGEGYYNGDKVKRKKSHKMEIRSHKFGLQRSKELRQLYVYMAVGETEQNCNTELSLNDVSDEEWYYLVSMSYSFTPGQCLPGKVLAKGETIWLCNAQFAESELFTRSLLAGSASIQTVLCLPYQGGVLELGVTESIAEDHNLLQQIKACIFDYSKRDFHNGRFSDREMTQEHFSNRFQNLQEGNPNFDYDEDSHYRRVVSRVLRQANSRIGNPNFDYWDLDSSFISWNEREIANRHQQQNPQYLLKKILYTVPLLHSARFQDSARCAISEKNRENEKFCVLRSMIPSIQQRDEESILNDTIKYLKDLEARVSELESCTGRTRRNNEESMEETSENYILSKSDEGIKPDVKIKIKEQFVVIEIRCPYREYVVADIMDAIADLQMDAHSVRSSTDDGYLTLSLKAKCRGAVGTPVGMIRRELRRVLEIKTED